MICTHEKAFYTPTARPQIVCTCWIHLASFHASFYPISWFNVTYHWSVTINLLIFNLSHASFVIQSVPKFLHQLVKLFIHASESFTALSMLDKSNKKLVCLTSLGSNGLELLKDRRSHRPTFPFPRAFALSTLDTEITTAATT